MSRTPNQKGTWIIISKSGEILDKFRRQISANERRSEWQITVREKCYVIHKDNLKQFKEDLKVNRYTG